MRSKEDYNKYRRLWREQNHERELKKQLEYQRKWREENTEKQKEYRKKYREKQKAEKPWLDAYRHAKSRCISEKDPKYKRYGGRGIKFLLTREEFVFLWKRDGASNMRLPNIDRIDNDGNYCISNCRFLECSDHSKKSNLERKGVNPNNKRGEL